MITYLPLGTSSVLVLTPVRLGFVATLILSVALLFGHFALIVILVCCFTALRPGFELGSVSEITVDT